MPPTKRLFQPFFRAGSVSCPSPTLVHALDAMPATPADSLDALLDADAWARAQACAFDRPQRVSPCA
jgi:hypothetical protein